LADIRTGALVPPQPVNLPRSPVRQLTVERSRQAELPRAKDSSNPFVWPDRYVELQRGSGDMTATRYTVKWKLHPGSAARQSERYNSELGAMALACSVLAQAPAEIWIEAADGRRVFEHAAIVSRWRQWRRATATRTCLLPTRS
jgi:hypothetical protein